MPRGKLLTDKTVREAKPKQGKAQLKLSDSGGLFLLARNNKHGIGKYWRLAYRFDGKQKELALGTYPQVSLKEAREKARSAKKLLEEHIDPNQQKKEDKQEAINKLKLQKRQDEANSHTFEVVAKKWVKLREHNWEPSYTRTVLNRLNRYMLPTLGSKPINEITKLEVSNTIDAVVSAGVLDTAKRVTQYYRNIFEYACDLGLIDAIPLGQTKNLVPRISKTPLPAIVEPKEVGALLRSIDARKGTFVVSSALKLLPYLAVRSGELRQAKWGEFDFTNALWTVPAKHLKQTKAEKENPANFHLVPLSTQVIAILKNLQKLTGSGDHVFPSAKGDYRPMSDGAINTALASMGYKGEMVGHGFRTVFSTLLNKKRFNPDAIERQLAHKDPNVVRAAYNRAEYIEDRTEMMQLWADYLDELRNDIY